MKDDGNGLVAPAVDTRLVEFGEKAEMEGRVSSGRCAEAGERG